MARSATCGWRWAAWRPSRGAPMRRKASCAAGGRRRRCSVALRRPNWRRRGRSGTTASRSSWPGARSWPCSASSPPSRREASHEHDRDPAHGAAPCARRAGAGNAAGRTASPATGQHGHIGQPVSRLDGALKVRGEARFAAEVAMDGLLLRRCRAFDDRARAHRVAGYRRRRGRARRRPGDDPSQCAADEGAGSVRRGRRRGRQQPARHAGRLRPLERRGGGPRAGGDAGAGRPCRRAGVGDLHGRDGSHRFRRRQDARRAIRAR